jgi:hypothetical protein
VTGLVAVFSPAPREHGRHGPRIRSLTCANARVSRLNIELRSLVIFVDQSCDGGFSVDGSWVGQVLDTVSTGRKSPAMIECAWAARNSRHVGPARRGGGPMLAACRSSHTVDAAIG